MEDRRCRDRCEIVDRLEGETNIGHGQAGGQDVVGDTRYVERRKDELRGQQRARQDHDGRWKDASGTARVEGTEADPSCALSLVGEQAGDQEPGEDEEDVHAHEPGAGAGYTRVAQQDEQDRDAAEPLEVRPEPGVLERPLRGRQHVRIRSLGHALAAGRG